MKKCALALALLAACMPIFSAAQSPPRRPAQALSDNDFQQILRAAYMIGEKLLMVQKNAAEMPAGDPLVHYAGINAEGKAELWIGGDAAIKAADPAFADRYNAAMIAGMALAAADLGSAGPVWKARYENAPDKVSLAHAVAEYYVMAKARVTNDARNNLRWFDRGLASGMPRSTVYRLLKKRGMIAFNPAYNPGQSIPGGGCNFAATQVRAQWPTFGQPLPKGGCLQGQRQAKWTQSPPVYVELTVDGNLACGTTRVMEIDFDSADRLEKIIKGETQTTCL